VYIKGDSLRTITLKAVLLSPLCPGLLVFLQLLLAPSVAYMPDKDVFLFISSF
jgi:hypothetical protein